MAVNAIPGAPSGSSSLRPSCQSEAAVLDKDPAKLADRVAEHAKADSSGTNGDAESVRTGTSKSSVPSDTFSPNTLTGVLSVQEGNGPATGQPPPNNAYRPTDSSGANQLVFA